MLGSVKCPPWAAEGRLGLAELVRSPVSSNHPSPWGCGRLARATVPCQKLTWAIGQVWPQAGTMHLTLFSFGDCFFLAGFMGSVVSPPSAHVDSSRVSFWGCLLVRHQEGGDPNALAVQALRDVLGGGI